MHGGIFSPMRTITSDRPLPTPHVHVWRAKAPRFRAITKGPGFANRQAAKQWADRWIGKDEIYLTISSNKIPCKGTCCYLEETIENMVP